MFTLTTGLGSAAWMVAGALAAFGLMALRHKLAERREIRQRGDWDSY